MEDKSRLECLCLHIVIGGFLFAYNLSVLNTSMENISASLKWGDNKDLFIVLSNSLVPVGALIGGIVTGSFSSKFGRRFTILTCDILTFVACLMTIFDSTELFMVGRFIIGIASGAFLTLAPIFVSEVTPKEYITRYGPYVQISTDVGVIVSYLLCLPLPTSDYTDQSINNWWRFMLAFPGIIALYQMGYFLFIFKFESPEWLMTQGREEEAGKAFKYLFPLIDQQGLESSEEDSKLISNDALSYKSLFSNKNYRKAVIIAISLAIIQQLSGINSAIIYSSYIFQEFGGSVHMSRIYTIISGFVFLISATSSILWLNYFGRKTLIILGQILICPVMLCLGFCNLYDLPIGLSVLLINLFYLFYSFSLGGAMWTYLGEILNDKLMSVSTSVNFFFVCLISFTFPIVSERVGIFLYFFIFSGFMVIGAVFSWAYLIETKGLSKKEIKAIFYEG